MRTIMRSSIGLAIALIILWFATVAAAQAERLPGAFDQADPGVAVEAHCQKPSYLHFV